MITKLTCLTAALLIAPMGFVIASAGQVGLRKAEPLRVVAPTYVTCRIKQKLLPQGPPKSQITIINDSGSEIAKDTTIYWEVGADKGAFNLPNSLRPFMSISTRISLSTAVADSVKAVAWYYK
jgi:hypothetical protein